eukprot:jgi/Undpi1/11726/HiC_scaffold_37.g14021.m1
MIENARIQLILVIMVAAAAIFYAFNKPQLGVDLRGGVQLIYEVPEERVAEVIADARTRNQALTIDQVMMDTISIISDRADPTGTQDIPVTRRGDYGIIIELPDMTADDAREIEQRISRLGKLEMRIVALPTYARKNNEGISFDFAEEKRRLESWLNENDGANRAAVLQNPAENIAVYNRLPANQRGTAAGDNLKWHVRRIPVHPTDSSIWKPDYLLVSYLQGSYRGFEGVQLFDPATDAASELDPVTRKNKLRRRADDKREYLIELIPINYHEEHFGGQDLSASGVYPTMEPTSGEPAVGYNLRAQRVDDYGEWSGKYKGEPSAIILNGEVRSAPSFRNAITQGTGIISGGFTEREVDELVRVLRTGSLKVAPRQQSKVVIGATLGEKAVSRGLTSVGIGGLLVLLFILAYYRMAGLVAFVGIAFNVMLIWGVLQFTRQTLTLPGIAGMVLTMGMAVDANILIYERIREELRKGKELLQACRTGFDKAMVTILDANITTFIAGLVLFSFGVGPIKGFAVTLMVGILTTLFTAFFVTRLAFHFMLEKEKLHGFQVGTWLQNAKYGFLKFAKPAFAISLLAIVASLSAVFLIKPDTLLGLDFTGGANLQMVMERPLNVTDVRQQLAGDAEFKKEFGEPQVNTIGELEDGKSRTFNIKIKLAADKRDEIDAERDAAADAGEEYEAPYVGMLRSTFEGDLVPPAFSNPLLTPLPGGSSNARIELHFATPVNLGQVRAKLAESNLPSLIVKAADGSEVTRDINVDWTAAPDRLDTELFTVVRNALEKHRMLTDGTPDKENDTRLLDAEGNLVVLSNPFPEAMEIGGRMVGELRNAAIGALILSLFLIVMFIRVRFHEYKYGIAAVAALVHDVCVCLGIVALANAMGWVDAELNLAMIAAFLTIIGYSINDTIVIFDRVRENLTEDRRLGNDTPFQNLVNRSINQTLSRTILTSSTTLFVVLAQFAVNYNSGSALEGFAFALIVGILSGTYSTIFIASPLLVWMRTGDTHITPEEEPEDETVLKDEVPEPAT